MKPRPPTLDEIDALAAAWVARRDVGLNAHEQKEFAHWCAANPLHAEAIRRFESTWAALGRPRRTGAAATLRSELNARVGTRRRHRLAAAVATLALLMGVFLWRSSTTPQALPVTGAPAVARTKILVPAHRVLPDGSHVELSEGAEVTEHFSLQTRRVRLVRGEAHFSVTKDPTRPFIVTAGEVEFRAVGTAFSVTLAPARVELLVTEGRVAVAQPVASTTEAAAPIETVDAGQRLALAVPTSRTATPAKPSVQALAPEEIARRQAWRRPRVEFSGAPLSEVVAIMNREQSRKIELGEPDLAKVSLSGRFQADDLDVFTTLLESGFGITAVERDGVILLLRSR